MNDYIGKTKWIIPSEAKLAKFPLTDNMTHEFFCYFCGVLTHYPTYSNTTIYYGQRQAAGV